MPGKASRTTRTAAERAQAALDVAQRRVQNLAALERSARAARTALAADLEAATVRRDYLAQDPALQAAPAPAAEQPSTGGDA